MIGLPNVFDTSDYKSYLRAVLVFLKQEMPRGEVTRLAKHMKCHPTFFSQVCRGKAHLSDEQALRLSSFFALDHDKKEFFLNLLHRDRASDQETREHFDRLLARSVTERAEIDKRWHKARRLSEDQERRYYQSWLTQAVHMACMFPDPTTPIEVSSQLGIAKIRVEKEFEQLIAMGLINRVDNGFKATDKHVHLNGDSPMLKNFHLGWRIRALELFDSSVSDKKNTHYSSVIALSGEAVASIQKIILDMLEQARQIVEVAAEEQIYLLNIDFCSLNALEERSAK